MIDLTISERTFILLQERFRYSLLHLENAKGRSLEGAQYDLREAIRCTYYTLFQYVSYLCTNSIIGSHEITDESWIKVFRSFDHKELKIKLSSKVVWSIDKNIEIFGQVFAEIQDERLNADYNPQPYLKNTDEVKLLIEKAASALTGLNLLSSQQILSLALLLIFKDRK